MRREALAGLLAPHRSGVCGRKGPISLAQYGDLHGWDDAGAFGKL